jgi:hypothetical protein
VKGIILAGGTGSRLAPLTLAKLSLGSGYGVYLQKLVSGR